MYWQTRGWDYQQGQVNLLAAQFDFEMAVAGVAEMLPRLHSMPMLVIARAFCRMRDGLGR
jgi:hypothetical protein